MADTTVGLDAEEVNDAIDFIYKNLQDTIGYWTEAEVTGALKDWRIAANAKIEEERRRREEEERRKREEEERRKREEEHKKYAKEIEEAQDNWQYG